MVEFEVNNFAAGDLEKILAEGLESALAQIRPSVSIEEDVAASTDNLTGVLRADAGLVAGSSFVSAAKPDGATPPIRMKVKLSGHVLILEFNFRDLFSTSTDAEEELREGILSAVEVTLNSGQGYPPNLDPAVMPIGNAGQLALPGARRPASEETIVRLVDALVETHDPACSN